ncbi:ankyrin repeat and SOCS box protein 16-like [Saccoglossus kowalevskii]|uniref:Serine/threonine-protein phosphatase 6 regulatory ankyrin repeat subunit B-like n=1 Tax=Saccoglossus kowalevskii TaxID=10224 RepID=A0ABM0GRG1_SACKO|nr:PREDICTED: serine/threonine-protein phosphatase 6 regulatory ankyrin repeat subunit B-like [Saccoglossus kowalevskii]
MYLGDDDDDECDIQNMESCCYDNMSSSQAEQSFKGHCYKMLILDNEREIQKLLWRGFNANMKFEIDQVFEVLLEDLDSIHADDPDIYDSLSALQVAIKNGSERCVDLLLGNGAEINAEVISMALSKDGHSCRVVKLLAEYSVTKLKTEMITVINCGCVTCLKLFLQQGTFINRESEVNSLPLHAVVELPSLTYPAVAEMLKTFCEYGADVNKENEAGETALFPAAIISDTDCVKLLLKFGSSADKVNRSNQTALHQLFANRHCLMDCIEELILNMTNVNIVDDYGFTPLGHAIGYLYNFWEQEHYTYPMLCRINLVAMFQFLINHGLQADINQISYDIRSFCYRHTRRQYVKEIICLIINSFRNWQCPIEMEYICKESLEKDYQFYADIISLGLSPRSLQHQCRCSLRNHLVVRYASVVSDLQITSQIKNYLLLEDLCDFS